MAVSLEREQLNADNIEHHLSNVVKDVRAKRLDLVNFVEELGPQLTDTDVEKRGYGVRFLSDVLHRLVGYPMQEKEVALFAEFLCDRLKDHYSITPVALFGILALVTNQRVAEADVVKIVQIIFKEVHIQSMLKEGRLTVFNLFAVLLDKNLKALTTLGNDFVFGFIQAVDGEKDPQNLLLVFRLVRIIITHFTIDLFAEDLFEVTSCYFPIDFTPPSNDPYGIKKEDLVSSLRKCLAATNQFAPFCLPLLMEKLSSDIVDAKIDSLLTLSACCEVYHSRYLLEHLDELWTAVKNAVFHSVNFDLEEASLSAVTSVVRNLCGSMEENSQEKYEEFLDTIQKDCVHFNGSDVRLMKPRGQLLQAAALAAEPACKKLIDCTFPLLLEQLKQNVETSHKKVLISIIGDLLKAAKTFHTSAQDSPVVKYKDSLCGSLFSLLSDVNSSLCCTAVDCLMTLVDLTGLMTDKEVELLLEHLTSIVLSNRETSVSQTSTACLAQLSRKYPTIVISKVLPSLLGQLEREDGSAMVIDSNHPQSTPVSHQCVLGTLSAMCTEASVVCEVIPRLITHAQYLFEVGNTCDGVKMKTNSVLRCLLGIVEGSIERGLISAAHFKQSVIPELMQMVLGSASNGSSDEGDVMQAAEVLDSVAAILRVVSRDLDIESAQSLQEEFARMFLEGKSTYWAALPDRTFLPLEVTSPWQQTQLVSLLTAALCSAKREVLTPRQSELVPSLQRLACHCDHERSAVSGAQCLAGIINKIPDGAQLTALLNDLISRIWQVTNKEGSLKRATVTWLWLTKAVVIRSHRLAPTFLEKVLSLLEDESVGRLAADGFYIIMADFEEVMNVKMHVNYRLMYRQRLFMETAPKLIEGFHSAKPAFKHHYLCALSHILQWIPKQVLLSEVPNLMPLLVHSLSCEEQSLKLSTLQTIYSLVLDAPEIITRHVTSLVPMLLGLSKFQPLMKIRVESLKCLAAMTTLPHHVVYPYKTKVCRALCDSVDDKKRIVRREAVKCRNEWFLLGSSAR